MILNRIMTEAKKPVASKETSLNSGNTVCKVVVPSALPNITILIHGVNDLGEAYDAQESGICKGLNERLNRGGCLTEGGGDLIANRYYTEMAQAIKGVSDDTSLTTDQKKEKLAAIDVNPDSIMYHRIPAKDAHSPIVPFFWGFREDGEIDTKTGQPKYINKTAKHGEWTDRDGNRIDKDGAKGGGPFANATTNLPDAFGPGFVAKLYAGDPLHPLMNGPNRRYMLLAGKRLAMLIKIIRNNPKTKNAAINIVGHSQGTIITLLAHAFLAEEDARVATDCFIMNNSPYSLEEPSAENINHVGPIQTSQARLNTLINIVSYITSNKQTTPPLTKLMDTGSKTGVVGANWKPGTGAKKWHSANSREYTFPERDNRGKVYLYFGLSDTSTAVVNVLGIGWQGIPDHINAKTLRDKANVYLPAFPILKEKNFFQRVFTGRVRDNKPYAVGQAPTRYHLKGKFEFTELPGFTKSTLIAFATSDVDSFDEREINGEELFPPCVPQLHYGEANGKPGKLRVGVIDARIALTHGGIGKLYENIAITPDKVQVEKRYDKLMSENFKWFAPDGNERNQTHNKAEEQQVLLQAEQKYYAGKPDPKGIDFTTFQSATKTDKPGIYAIRRTESAREARKRWEDNELSDNSTHSSIVGNPMHSTEIHAYDLALGEPIPTELKGFMQYLCAVADWRTKWKDLENEAWAKDLLVFYNSEKKEIKDLINLNTKYYKEGKLPDEIIKCPLPTKTIISWDVEQRYHGEPCPTAT